MRPKSKPKSKPDAKYSKACVFCCSEEENEEAYGKMLRKSGITIHYFCMLFSSGLWQRGKRDQDGILGFLPADIRREQKRGLRLSCQYCKKKGATIGCCVSSCRKTFHFRCGREAGGMSQFFQEFRSYCPEHRPRQVTPTSASDRLAFYGTAKSTCSICMLAVEARSSNDTLRSPCCRNAWFHRDCIQRYAVTAGAYFFKCPLCNNKDLFEAEMLQFGIYIPEQDAAWEQEPNAYQELLERYNRCDADKCLCPQGREHDGSAGTRWELMLCMWCGSSGSHFGCRAFTKVGKDRVCSECFEISAVLEKDKKKKKRSVSSPRQARPSLQEIRHEVQQRRSTSLRAQRVTQQEGSPPPDSRGQQPSTSERSLRILRRQQAQGSIAAFAPLSVNDEETRVVSPSLLQDRRLTASIPVVRVKRADSEVEVNVTDSDEEEASGSASEDLHGSGCARLRGLPEPSLARLHGGPRQVAATWDVKSVIEKGQRKVVLLSMLNQQGYSSDSSMQSTTSTIQTCLRLRSKLEDSEMEGTDSQQELQSAKLSHQHHRGQPRKVSKECGPERDSQSTQSSNTPQKRGRGRPRKIKHNFLSKNIQYGSDDNNNFSAENSSVDRDSLSPAPSTSKSSPRRTRSVTLNCHKRASDSSSEERDCDVSLAQLGVKRRRVTRGHDNVESEKRLTETKGKSQHKYQSSSPDSSTSAESLTTKVRYRRALQRASHSSRQHSKLGIDDNAESHDSDSKSKSHLSTDVQGLRSRTLAMTPDSKLGSSFEQDHDSISTVKMSDVGPEGEVHLVAEETERKFRQAECEGGSLKVANDRDFHSLAAPSGEIAKTGEKGDSSVSAMSGNPSQPGVYESAASMLNQDTTGTIGSAVPDALHAQRSPVPSAYAQFQVPRPQLKKAGQGLGVNSASAVPVSRGLSVPPPLISYAEACGGTHPDLKASTQPCVGSPSNAQPHQLGVVAASLQPGSVSATPATQPYPVAVVAVQPHHAVPRTFSTMASSSASFTQWIGTLRDCYHSQPQAEQFLTATQPHGAMVVPTTQLPSGTASIAQPYPAVVTGSQPYPATDGTVTQSTTVSASAGRSDPYPLSLVPSHLLPVPPNLAQPPDLAQAVSGECSQPYLVALTTARVSQQNPAPVSVTSAWSASAVMSTRQSAPATHQQTSALQASQAVPVPGSLYVAAGNVAPVPESHSTSGRRVSSNPEVPVPVSLFHSSYLASAPIPSSVQQPASIAQPSDAAARVSLQAVNTSQASTASYNTLQQQLTAAPNCYQDPNMLPSAGHFRQTVPRALRDRVTRLAGAQMPVGNQQNRLALPVTADPVAMRPLVSQPAPAERCQQGGWTASQSTHPEAERSQHGEWTAGRSAHPGKSRQGKWAASQLTDPEGSQQGGCTTSQLTHPEGSHGMWTASWSTQPDGSQQGGWTASQSMRPVGSQGQTARQSARPQGSQQRQASGHPPAAAASQQRVGRGGMSAPQSQSSAPSRGQQVMSSALPAVAQPGTGSTQQENVLPSSRGKIWLSPEPMQTMLCKEAEVVVLSDSDDSDAELRITGTSPAQVPVKTTASCRRRTHSHAHSHMAGSFQSKPESGGGSGHPGSGHRPVVSQPVAPSPQQSSGQSQQPGRIATGTTPSSTQLTSSVPASHKPTEVAPAYNRPPCPVHGYSRLVPRRRKFPIGPLTIDLTDTDKELAAKKRHFAEPEVTLSSDSDVEIIS